MGVVLMSSLQYIINCFYFLYSVLFLGFIFKMRFNKQELVTLATQPSTKFEKEGILYIRERQEGFFRKSESKYAHLYT